jgi:hypothetical protein
MPPRRRADAAGRADDEHLGVARFRVVPYERMSGWSSKASEAELKGVDGGY